jgi:ABC-type anion transport system duplicated permease subunit
MLQLCVSPKTAYRHTSYQKQTKNQWARDDPAFAVVCCLLLAAAAAAYCATYGHSLWHSLLSIVSAVVVDFLVIGLAISSTCWCVHARAASGAGARDGAPAWRRLSCSCCGLA